MPEIRTWDARNASWGEVVAQETSAEALEAVVTQASDAARELSELSLSDRAGLLEAMADALDADGEHIRALADLESGLGQTRLVGELGRTTGQLRFMASIVRDGAFLDLTIDHANPDANPPQPDLRRMNVPLGVVAVFAASNFPLAFSVAGGDTASALAAGCAVVVKAHPSHPATSVAVQAALARASQERGLRTLPVTLVFGNDAGLDLVRHPQVRAVGFTGSLAGGKALLAAINEREDPIPFYGELGSINPLVVTGAAAAERATQIGEGLAASLTTAAGQFCTKPGVSFVPTGPDGDALVAAAAAAMTGLEPMVPLNDRIGAGFASNAARAADEPSTRVLVRTPTDDGTRVGATLLEIDATAVDDDTFDEVFGPFGLLIRYDDEEALADALAQMPGSLTGTVHIADGEDVPAEVARVFRDRVGRIIVNGFPTGVAVTWSQQHGGPFPAATTAQTSVGAASVGRFVRAVTWQDAPASLLPAELRDDSPPLPRRVDGRLLLD